MRSEFANATVITVAHRLDTIIESDRVFVMDKGRVIEEGSPSTLLARNDSSFQALVRQTGRANTARLLELARAADAARAGK